MRSLSENAHRRVPRRGIALYAPTPVAVQSGQQPDRLAHRPRQMCHGGVDCNNKIEGLDQRSRVQKVYTFIDSLMPLAEYFIGVTTLLLKAHQLHARYLAQASK